MSRKLTELEIGLQCKAVKAIAKMRADEELKKMGVEDIAIVETRRTLATQMAYYARGRMAVEDVKKMYRAAGLYNLTDEEAKTKNTWTLDSKHLEGKAIDLAPIKDCKIWWSAPNAVWEQMGKIGESEGMQWGGRWKDNKDTPHFQI